MKHLKIFFLGVILTLTSNANAQSSSSTVCVDNQTTCDYVVKANIGVDPCLMGMGPIIGSAGGSVNCVPIPGWGAHVTGYGVNQPGQIPVLVGNPSCGLNPVVTLPASHPNACASKVTVIEYHGNTVVIK